MLVSFACCPHQIIKILVCIHLTYKTRGLIQPAAVEGETYHCLDSAVAPQHL